MTRRKAKRRRIRTNAFKRMRLAGRLRWLLRLVPEFGSRAGAPR